MSEPHRISDVVWELPREGAMRVPARVFADEEILEAIKLDHSLDQLRNVATLPGIVDAGEADVERAEWKGCLDGADPPAVSERARERGGGQLGTMGSGNHFVEVQRVGRVLGDAFGLRDDQVTILIHSGSRGLGHQV